MTTIQYNQGCQSAFSGDFLHQSPSRTIGQYYADYLRKQQKNKTYSSRDSHVVTHRSTNLPFNCLCMAERTGCPVFS
ncbi:hypothetical protein KCU62_g9291, partial [Aureobasidium sp. EXF-3399]